MEINYRDMMPVRDELGNKGTFGKVTVIAGSYGMAGAAYLCSLAVMRSGAGMVRIFTPEANRVILQTLIPEAILSIYDSDTDIEAALSRAIEWADVIAAGPGLGTAGTSPDILKTLFRLCETRYSHKKLILDADALNLISMHSLPVPPGCILTPHLMEMSRLSGISVEELRSDAKRIGKTYAMDNNCVLVMKDHETVITGADGDQVTNHSGSSALATAGTGDVLTGIIAGLLAQGMEAYDAAVLGVYIHGISGEKCAAGLTEYGVLSRDVANCIPYAIYSILNTENMD